MIRRQSAISDGTAFHFLNALQSVKQDFIFQILQRMFGIQYGSGELGHGLSQIFRNMKIHMVHNKNLVDYERERYSLFFF